MSLIKPLGVVAPSGVFYFLNNPKVHPRLLFRYTYLSSGIKILSKSADIFNRRNDMIIKYLILGFTIVYVATVIIIYLKPDRSA